MVSARVLWAHLSETTERPEPHAPTARGQGFSSRAFSVSALELERRLLFTILIGFVVVSGKLKQLNMLRNSEEDVFNFNVPRSGTAQE